MISKRYTILGTALALGLAAGASAQQVRMKVADHFPPGDFIAESGTKFFMEEVKRQTNGAVQFDYFPGEQLGKTKDMLTLVNTGTVDIGYILPAYVTDKMPLSAVAELPGQFGNSCVGTLAYWKLARGDGILSKQEYGTNQARIVFAFVYPPYQLFTRKQAIEGIKSLEGLKIRTAGAAMDVTARTFNAVPIRVAGPEVYEALSRGTVDGMFFPYAAAITYNLIPLIKHVTVGESFGSTVNAYIISESRWSKLSPAAQKAIDTAGEATTRRLCKMADENVEKDVAAIRQKGVTVASFPAAERARVARMNTEIGDRWAADMDKRGKSGTALLKSYRAELGQKN